MVDTLPTAKQDDFTTIVWACDSTKKLLAVCELEISGERDTIAYKVRETFLKRPVYIMISIVNLVMAIK